MNTRMSSWLALPLCFAAEPLKANAKSTTEKITALAPIPRANVRDVFELYRGERDARKVATVMTQWTEAVAALERLVALPAALQAQLFDHDWHHKNDGRTPKPHAQTPS